MAKTPKILNAHAKRRAEERYGINLNKYARREIVQMIQTNQAEFVGKHSNNRSFWRVPFQSESLNVMYDRKRRTMCTVLPKDAVEFQQPSDWTQPQQKREKRMGISQEFADLWRDED